MTALALGAALTGVAKPAGAQAVAAPERIAGAPAATPLDTYVARPDDSFAWEVAPRTDHADRTDLVVRLTSQTWRDASEV
ncbi:MAG: hypothetical protein AAF411_25210, partial [Myxococcota bacterium]